MVEQIVSTHDKQSRRHTSESTSNLISSIFTRKERIVPRSKEVSHNLGNLGLPLRLGFPFISERQIQAHAPPVGGAILNWRKIAISPTTAQLGSMSANACFVEER